MEPEETRARIRAARTLRGYGRAELADRLRELGYTKLGKDTLYNIETGRRPIVRPDLNAIAEACDIDPAFFTVDLRNLSDPSTGRVDQLEQQLADMGEKLDTLTVRVLPMLVDYEEEEASQSDAQPERSSGQRPSRAQRA